MSRAEKVQRLEAVLVRVLARKDITRVRPQTAPTGPGPRPPSSRNEALEALMGPAMELAGDDLSEVPTSIIQGRQSSSSIPPPEADHGFRVEGRARAPVPSRAPQQTPQPPPPELEPAAAEATPLVEQELPSVEVADTPEVALADAPEVALADAPEVELADAPEVEVANAPAVEVADAPGVEVADAPAVELADAPAVELADAPEVEVADAPEVEVADAPEVEVADAPIALETIVPQEVTTDDGVAPGALTSSSEVALDARRDAPLTLVPDEDVAVADVASTVDLDEPQELELEVAAVPAAVASMRPSAAPAHPDATEVEREITPEIQRIRESIPAPQEPESLKPPRELSSPPEPVTQRESFAASVPPLAAMVSVIAGSAAARPRTLRGMMERSLSLRPRR